MDRTSAHALLALTLALGPLGCGPGAPSGDAATGTDAVTSGDTAPGEYYLPAGYTLTPFVSAGVVRRFSAAGAGTEPNRDYLAVMETDAGRIVLDLYETQTPVTVNSFVWLARNHFFDGVAFHRVLENFVAQGGDPNTVEPDRARWGTGGPGYFFGLEIVDTLRYDSAGVLGMARSTSPDTNGSQFFITLAPVASLDGMYTVFGRVTEGMDVLARISRSASDTAPPVTPTRMTRVYIVERAL